MVTESGGTNRGWTYCQASKAVPYIRVLLRTLRVSYIGAWHYARLSDKESGGEHRGQMRCHCQDGQEALTELGQLGVLAYDNPLRGIALFPLVIQDGGEERGAYFVYKDSRDGIDTFILRDELCQTNDLFGFEEPVPESWKQPGTVPKVKWEARP